MLTALFAAVLLYTTGTWTLERAGFLPPMHGIYQWQNDRVRGEATTSFS
jgi:hypothetical protein